MAWRKSRTSDDTSSKSTTSGDPFRHLDDNLAGVIFGCTDGTYEECVKECVFGLPAGHISYVRGIKVGTPLFLFNYSRRELHGVFAAASKGEMNLRPHGWTGGTLRKTNYPAQVRVRLHKKGKPLKEHEFKKAIQKNYDCEGPLFQFELDKGQVKLLCRMFKSSVPRIQSTGPIALKPPLIRPHATQQCGSDGGHGADVGTTSLSQSSSRSRRRRSRLIRSQLIASSSCTEEDASSVLEELDDKASSDQRSQTDPTNAQSSRSIASEEQSVRDSVDTGRSSDDALGSSASRGQVRRPRRTLGEVNGIFTQAAIQRIDGMHRTRRPLSLVERPSQERELLPLQDDLLMQFLQLNRKDERFFAHETGDTLLLIGGVDEEECFSRIEILQEDRRSWKASLFVPSFRSIGSQAVGIDDRVVLLGGTSQEHETPRAVEMLKSGWKRWKSMQPMPHRRPHFAACSLGTAIFTMGGGEIYNEVATCERFDDSCSSWMRAPSLIQERHGCASCASSLSILFVAGGGRRGTVLRTVEMLDVRSNKWQKIPAMRAARKHHALVSFQEEVWALGGEDGNGVYLSSAEAYDLRNQQWREMPSLIHPRAFFTVEVLDHTLHVLGGSAAVNVVDGCYLSGEQYSCEEASWIEGLPAGRSGKRGHHTSCIIRNGHLTT